jgi:hypothetical protein
MSAEIIQFPKRHRFAIPRSRAVWVFPGDDYPWWVVAGSHGWIHSDVASAWADARWLSDNLGYPIRVQGASE